MAVLAVAGVVAALVVGQHVHHNALVEARAVASTATPVSVELVRDIPPVYSAAGRGSGSVRAPIRWTDSTGQAHTATAPVSAGHRAGDRITVWVNHRGHVVPTPVSSTEATLAALFCATLALAGVAIVLGLSWIALTGWT